MLTLGGYNSGLARGTMVVLTVFALLGASAVVLPAEVSADLPRRIAYFRDWDPWGMFSNEDAMDAVGIPYDYYTSADFGTVVLGDYKKIVVASAQPYSFYQAIVSNKARLEMWILNGGVFEMHMATYSSDDWAGLFMPTEFTSEMDFVDDVAIVDPHHDIINVPNPIAGGELDGWNYASHGYVRSTASPHDILIAEEGSGEPVGVEIFFGYGTVLATMQTLEWAYDRGYSSILENFIAYMPVRYDHDLAVVGIEVPDINERTQMATVNATIKNLGRNQESGFRVNFLINGIPSGFRVIPSLATGNNTVVSFPWTPMVDGSYNLTIEVPPVP
ncbi:MAG: hypothetical protein KAW09_02465, partial [Thermoplasmata archaeon]|nr:hypothetical protein [Thermoplasmata archaeon]